MRYRLHLLDHGPVPSRVTKVEPKATPKPVIPREQFNLPPPRKLAFGSMGGGLTTFRITLVNMDTGARQDIVVKADCITHCIAQADKLACTWWPGATVSFENVFRCARPDGGYTYGG